jgi:hypothetical protein
MLFDTDVDGRATLIATDDTSLSARDAGQQRQATLRLREDRRANTAVRSQDRVALLERQRLTGLVYRNPIQSIEIDDPDLELLAD